MKDAVAARFGRTDQKAEKTGGDSGMRQLDPNVGTIGFVPRTRFRRNPIRAGILTRAGIADLLSISLHRSRTEGDRLIGTSSARPLQRAEKCPQGLCS